MVLKPGHNGITTSKMVAGAKVVFVYWFVRKENGKDSMLFTNWLLGKYDLNNNKQCDYNYSQ